MEWLARKNLLQIIVGLGVLKVVRARALVNTLSWRGCANTARSATR